MDTPGVKGSGMRLTGVQRAHAEGGGHGLVVHGGLGVSGGQVRPGVVPALVVVVLDVEAGELGEADPQRAAGVVDVLPVQGLETRERTGFREVRAVGRRRLSVPGEGGEGRTSLECWAAMPSAYCSSAWNWPFLVKVMIFSTTPNLEKIYSVKREGRG